PNIRDSVGLSCDSFVRVAGDAQIQKSRQPLGDLLNFKVGIGDQPELNVVFELSPGGHYQPGLMGQPRNPSNAKESIGKQILFGSIGNSDFDESHVSTATLRIAV